MEAEFRQAVVNLEALLDREGASLAQVRKTTVFLRHMRDYSLMNEVYAEMFPEPYPARSAFAVSELPFVALVEIEAWAYIGSYRSRPDAVVLTLRRLRRRSSLVVIRTHAGGVPAGRLGRIVRARRCRRRPQRFVPRCESWPDSS